MGWKIGVSVVTALLVLVGVFNSESSDTADGTVADPAKEAEVSTTTSTPPTTTTATPTTTTPPTTAPPTTVPPTTTAAPPPPPTTAANPFANESVSQRNARQKAADYLDFSSFSRSGLIDQLKFEGFSESDAAHGVDAMKVDWNEQAAKKAADYLDFSSFSRSSLIDQLVFDGFTQQQAEYGVGTTGL